LNTKILSSRLCQLCASDLETFSSLRADLLEKQRSLYVLADINVESISLPEESETVFIEEEGYEKIESGDQFEMIEEEEDCGTEILWDDGEEFEEAIEDEMDVDVMVKKEEGSDEGSKEEVYSVAKKYLKIEKIEGSRKRKISQVEASEIQYENFDSQNEEPYEISLEDEPMTQCTICDMDVLYSFFDYHVEQMHVSVACDKCEETFESKILLKKHDLDSHPVFHTKGGRLKKKSYLCTLCDKQYEYKKNLDDHIRSFHKKVRNKVCHICHRAFYHRDIKKHIEHVHGTKTVECGVCGKFYSCLENLKLHMKYHAEPRYQCEIQDCGKKFHQKILWKHHMLKHSTNKPIECLECGNLFYTLRGKIINIKFNL
jgi:Zinc finger, C2H2 type